MIYIQNHILRVKILNRSGLGKVAIGALSSMPCYLPLSHSFYIQMSATAQSRTVAINMTSICCMLADSVILNVILDSEANYTCIEHSKVVQYNRQTQERVYAYICVVQNVHNNRLRWSWSMKKGKTVRDNGNVSKMMKFVLEGLLLLHNHPFIIHILSWLQKPNSSLLVCKVPCSSAFFLGMCVCGSTQLVDWQLLL